MSIPVPLKGFGGGGANLNFKVVGNLQPTSPRENTIWLNTDQEITSWIFSAAEPETPEEGMVWFSVGTSSPVEFNALKKNAIQVYPLSAKQYVDGAWVTVTAMSYQGGEWVSWIRIFENLNVNQWIVTESEDRVEISNTDDGLLFTFVSGSSWVYVSGYLNEKIDFANYSTVVFQGTENPSSETVYLCIYDEDASIVTSVELPEDEEANLEDYPIDCSSLTEVGYVGINVRTGYNVGSVTIKSITVK